MPDLVIKPDGTYAGTPSDIEVNVFHGGTNQSKLVGAKRGDVWVKPVAATGGSGAGGGFPANYNQVAVIGNSRIAMDGLGPSLIVNGLVAKGKSASDIFVVGIYGARINDPGGNSGNIVSNVTGLSGVSSSGYSMIGVVDALRARGIDPRTWYIIDPTNNELSASGGPSTWTSEYTALINRINSGPAGNYQIVIESIGYGPGSDRAPYVDQFTTFLNSFVPTFPNVTQSSSYPAYLNAVLASVGSTTYNTYWENANENIHNSNPLGWQVVRAPFVVATILNQVPAIPTAPPPTTSTTVGAQPGVARRAKGSLDPFGRTVVWIEDLGVGNNIQAAANKLTAALYPNGAHLSLPNGNFVWSGLAVNGLVGNQLGNGFGGNTRAVSGSGSGTHLYQAPNTIPASAKSQIPTVAGQGTNPIFQIAFSHVTNPLLENLSLEYTDQGCLWNGVYFASCTATQSSPHCYNVWFNGFGPGNSSVNPGECFEFDGYQTNNLWLDHCTFNGKIGAYAASISGNTTSASTKVTGSNVGMNSLSNVKMTNCITQDAGYGAGYTNYKVNGCTIINCWSINNLGIGFNNERSASGTLLIQDSVTYGTVKSNRAFVVDSDQGNVTVKIVRHTSAINTQPDQVKPVLQRHNQYWSPPVNNTQLMTSISYTDSNGVVTPTTGTTAANAVNSHITFIS